MIHPDTYVKSTDKGLGLFAGRPFAQGEILWIADDFDIKIPLGEYLKLSDQERRRLDKFSYLDYKRRVIIPWDEGKYVNHSCDPNSTGVLQYDNISIAIREIDEDEEIVEDYYSYFGHFGQFDCSCGAVNCRNSIYPDNDFNSRLRLDLNDVAPLILSQRQYLLEIPSSEIQDLLDYFENFTSSKVRARDA